MTVFNQFDDRTDLASPAARAIAVTPDDATALTLVTRGIYVGGAGNLAVTMKADDNDVTYVGVAAGSVLPLRVTHVLSTGTTATNIVALA